MRRLGAHCLNVLTLLSLVLSLASALMWVRSYWRADYAYCADDLPHFAEAMSVCGEVTIAWENGWPHAGWRVGSEGRDPLGFIDAGLTINFTPTTGFRFWDFPGVHVERQSLSHLAAIGLTRYVPEPHGYYPLTAIKISWWAVCVASLVLPTARLSVILAARWVRRRRLLGRGFQVEPQSRACA
jgi:hypothetical protein